MDIVASLNSAFTQVQRSENMSFRAGDQGTQVGYRERESTQNLSGQVGQFRGNQKFLPASSGGDVRSAVQNAVNYDRSERGTLTLLTQEGDTVKLKFLNSESYNAQNQQFEGGGSVLSDFSMSGSNSSNFKVVVEGDLNGEELSAIRGVLVQAREMANNFYDGNVESAFSTAGQFQMDSEQLANVSMQFNLRENYTYANAVVETPPQIAPPSNPTQPIAPAVESVPTAQPTAEPATPASIAVPVSQPDVTAAAPTPSVVQPLASELVQEIPDAPEPVETLVHSEPDVADPLSSALTTISNFLNQIASTFESFNQQSQAPSGNAAFSFSGGFQLQVMSSLIGQMDSSLPANEPSGNSLAAATLDVVAMRMDARFEVTI